MFRALVAVVLAGFCSLLHAEVYLCKLANGERVAQDTPCPQGATTQYEDTVPSNPRAVGERGALDIFGNDMRPTIEMKSALKRLQDHAARRDVQSLNPHDPQQGKAQLEPEEEFIGEDLARRADAQKKVAEIEAMMKNLPDWMRGGGDLFERFQFVSDAKPSAD
jgi:hypothetical protein